MIREQFNLANRVALVVGGRGYLGGRFCSALAEFGARVFAADLPISTEAATYDEQDASSVRLEQRDVDVGNKASVEALVNSVVAETSGIDILVYSVTAKPKDFYKPFVECSLEGWQQILRAELDGLFLMTQQVGRVMETAHCGSIILLASIYGLVGNDQRIYQGANLAEVYGGAEKEHATRIYAHSGYAAAKGAVISLTRFLAAYWGELGIRVNCISPGGVAHPKENEEFVKHYSTRVPLGRKAGMDEISAAVVYLASDASSYVTGHNLVIDGGWTAW